MKDKVIDLLKEEARKERERNRPFAIARKEVEKREKERLTHYQRFKRQQDKERKANEMLREYLEKNKNS